MQKKSFRQNDKLSHCKPATQKAYFSDLDELLGYLNLDRDSLPEAAALIKNFPLRVSLDFARQIEKGNPDDPLLLQVLPSVAETRQSAGYITDPVGDIDATVHPGIIKKYQSRVLLITTGACPIHCRYCFRRNFPYSDSSSTHSNWSNTLNYLQQNLSIEEVILSGGDPLSLGDSQLARLFEGLDLLAHIKRIRIHTRFPVAKPDRFTPELITLLTNTRKKLIIVTHINHPNEISPTVEQLCQSLNSRGIILLNQSVLLKNINNTPDTLIALSEKLISANIVPYYLNLLDPVQGSQHFEVTQQDGINLIKQMKQRCSGYLVPRLVREQKNASAKLTLV